MSGTPTTKRVIARGQGASPGQATGEIVFRSEDAVLGAAQGRSIILVRIETGHEDVEGLKVAVGVVTTRGGLTSDAAIIARALGKPCIAGCSAMVVNYKAEKVTIGRDDATGLVLAKGHVITIDGAKGMIYDG